MRITSVLILAIVSAAVLTLSGCAGFAKPLEGSTARAEARDNRWSRFTGGSAYGASYRPTGDNQIDKQALHDVIKAVDAANAMPMTTGQ